MPKRESLAEAIRNAITASAPAGITARVAWTDNLVPSSDLQQSDPLLEGGTGRLWLSKDALRIELQGTNGDAELLVRNDRFWLYDPSMNTVLRGTLPQPRSASRPRRIYTYSQPTLENVQSVLTRLAGRLTGLTAHPNDVAGRPAYRVTVAPKRSASLIGAVSTAWDAIRGVPLSFDLYSKRDATPVLALTATSISYGRVNPSVFAIEPPAGARAMTLRTGHTSSGGGKLLTFGRGLGRVLVFEHRQTGSRTASSSAAPADAGANLTLPTRTVDGVTAQLLETEIGTVVSWTRDGTTFTVVGFVPAAEALRVARAL